MSRSELVQNYLDGQLSRRVFIRGMIATGVSAAAALSYAGLLESAPAGAAAADFYLVMSDQAFNTPARLAQGQGVLFANHGNLNHNPHDTQGLGLFDTPLIPPNGQFRVGPPPGSGNFAYHCDLHPAMVGQLRVPIVITPTQAALGSRFLIRWAVNAPRPGLVFDVQRRRPGRRNFANWRTGVTSKSAFLTPGRKGNFAFRARVRRPATGARSAWSVVKILRVT